MQQGTDTSPLHLRLIQELDKAGSVDDIYDSLSKLAHRIIQSDRASITTFQNDELTLESRSIYDTRSDQEPQPVLGFSFTLRGNRSDYIEHALKPRIWHTTNDETGHDTKKFEQLGMRSVMNVPLVSNSAFVGTLNLGSRTRIFQPDDLIALRKIAALANIALERFADVTRVIDMSHRTRLFARQLDRLNDLGERLLSVTHLEQALDITANCIKQLVGARRVSYVTLEPNRKTIRINALVGGTSDHAGLTVSLADSGLAEVILHGKPLFVPDLQEAPHRAHRSLGRSGLAHLWAFPVKCTNAPNGALAIATEKSPLGTDEASAILGTLTRLLESTLSRIAAHDPQISSDPHHTPTPAPTPKTNNAMHGPSFARTSAPADLPTARGKQLAAAIAQHELHLEYQPVVDPYTGKVHCVESLLRWHSRLAGNTPATEIIATAESNNLLNDVSEWVLQTALKSNSRLQKQFPGLRTSVNIADIEFSQPAQLIARIQRAIDASQTTSDLLEIELRESALERFPDSVATVVDQLKQLGITIILDNLGTSTTPLPALVSLPLSAIKLDRLLCHKADLDHAKLAVVQNLTKLSAALGLGVVATGIETEAQLDCVQTADFSFVQGNLLCEPVDEFALPGRIQSIQMNTERLTKPPLTTGMSPA